MKTLIFDFDGTIADSFETLLAIFEEITNKPQGLTPQEIKSLRGSSLKEIIRYLEIKRWQIPRLLLKGKRLVALRISKIQAFSGMPETLKQLHDTGYQMFTLSTNSNENIVNFLEKNKLNAYFLKIYGDIGLRSKSSALRKIMRKERLTTAECFYIGDEVRDIEAAKRTGMHSIAVAWGFNSPEALRQAKPDSLAYKPRELIKYLSS